MIEQMVGNLNIAGRLVALNHRFEDRFDVSLWSRSPLKEIAEIDQPVTNEDALVSRVACVGRIFDVLNMAEFKKKSGVAAEGTRDSFINFLKHEFPDDHPFVQDLIEMPLGRVFQLRAVFMHPNQAGVQLLNFFDLKDVLTDPSDTWIKVRNRLLSLLDSVLELLNRNPIASVSGSESSIKPLRILVQETYESYRELLEDPVISLMLREIMHNGELLDTDLAFRFNRPIKEIRTLLFPLLDKVVRVRPHDSSSTKLRINGPMAAALENPDEWLKDEVT